MIIHENMIFYIGSLAIAGTGMIAIGVAMTNPGHWCSYGREILFWLGFAQFAFVTNRILTATHTYAPWTAQLVGGMIGLVLFCIVLNLMVVHLLWHGYGLAERGRNQHAQDHSQLW